MKMDAEVIDTISVGLLLVRVAKGSHATLELTGVTDEVPDRLQVFTSARGAWYKPCAASRESITPGIAAFQKLPRRSTRQKAEMPATPSGIDSVRPPPHERG
jgi:hypothetical protein